VFLWWVFVWNIDLFLKTIVASDKDWSEGLFFDKQTIKKNATIKMNKRREIKSLQ
jgi:hypothetical protein